MSARLRYRAPRVLVYLVVCGLLLALIPLRARNAFADGYADRKYYREKWEQNLYGKQDLVDSPLGDVEFYKEKHAYYGLADTTGADYGYTPLWRVDGNKGLIYCANHDRSAPYNTRYKTRELYVENESYTADDLKAVLYFGFGGPGYDRSLFPSRNYDNTALDNDDLFAFTHLLVHYVYTGNWETTKKGQQATFTDWAESKLIGTGGTLSKILNKKSFVPSGFKAFLMDSEYDGTFQQLIGFMSADTIIVDKQGVYADPLDGAVFGIYSDAACTQEVCRITTDSTGRAETQTLSSGSYYVKEIAAPAGYGLNDTVFEATVGTPGQSHFIVKDKAQGARVTTVAQKVDAETGATSALGAASLAGAEFEVRCWPGATDYGVVSTTEPALRWLLKTDNQGLAQLVRDQTLAGSDHLVLDYLGKPLVPKGVVSVRETKAPEGYLLSSYVQTALVTESTQNGQAVFSCALSTDAEHQTSEQVIRGDVSFVKKEAGTDQSMGRIPFLMSSKTTGEAHIIVSDEQGKVDTSRNRTTRTNANDSLLSTDSIDSSKLDLQSGVWFTGRSDLTTQPSPSSHGSLPYDSYTIQELRCSANVAHTLASFDVTVTADGLNQTLDTVYDVPQRLSTTATSQGRHMALPSSTTTITDQVAYEGLEPGHSYQLSGSLHLRDDDGSDSGIVPGTQSIIQTLEPTSANGTIEMNFTLDSSQLAGKTVVVFERLEENGQLVCAHEDISDAQQSVRITRLKTQARDKADNDQELVALPGETIVDTVSYVGLDPGERYELEATLHVREGNSEDGGVVQDSRGSVQAHMSFTPSTEQGEVSIELPLDASSYAGKDLVVYERLYLGSDLIAHHEDPGDDKQTLHVNPAPLETGVDQGLPQTGEIAGAAGAIVTTDGSGGMNPRLFFLPARRGV